MTLSTRSLHSYGNRLAPPGRSLCRLDWKMISTSPATMLLLFWRHSAAHELAASSIQSVFQEIVYQNGDLFLPTPSTLGSAGMGALMRTAVFGPPVLPPESERARISRMKDTRGINPVFRRGGLIGSFLSRSYNDGIDCWISSNDQNDGDYYVHEAFHHYQSQRDGYAQMRGRAIYELLKYGDPNVYKVRGTLENEAWKAESKY